MEILTQIRTYRFSSGTNRPVLLGAKPGGVPQPLFYPNLYISYTYSPDNEGTITQVFNALKCLYAWGVWQDIDFQARLLALQFIDDNELENMRSAMLVEYPDLRAKAERRLGNHDAKPSVSLERVGARTANSRLGFIRGYFRWLVGRAIAQRPHSEREEWQAKANKRDAWFDEKKFDPAPTNPVMPLTEVEMGAFCRVIVPGSPDNPWSPDAQRRNYIIVRCYFETGARRSELLAVKLKDIPPGQNKINLTRRMNDAEDPRIPKARVKTVGRPLHLAPSLRQAIGDYVKEERRKAVGKGRHPFLLVSHQDGKPLSSSSITKIFSGLRDIEGLKDVHPHRLRHTATHEQAVILINLGHNPKLVMDALKEDFGWSPNSMMPLQYLQKVREEARIKLAEKMEKRFERDED